MSGQASHYRQRDKMNKRESLEITLMKWDHIAINKCSEEEAIKALGFFPMIQSSALCEYDMQVGRTKDMNFTCTYCPVVWAVMKKEHIGWAKCLRGEYGMWFEKKHLKTQGLLPA